MAQAKANRRGGTLRSSVALAFRRAKKGERARNELEENVNVAYRTAKTKKTGVHIGNRAKLVGRSKAEIDKLLSAKAPGYRISKHGKLYYESRKNRAD